VVEVDRPNRQTRRKQGKSDPTDAISAARAALSGEASVIPKTRDDQGSVQGQIQDRTGQRSSSDHAAGYSGQGVFEAARVESIRQGQHLWAIGVDTDEYSSVLDAVADGGPDPATWQPHILTSMIKRFDIAVHTLILEFASDEFRPGLRVFRLADEGVGYSTSGGFIDDLVPTIEDLEARIVAGEIVVPEVPAA
jgi:hypothetical protein